MRHIKTVASSAIVVTAGIYSAADAVGNKMTFTNLGGSSRRGGEIRTAVLTDASKQAVDLILVLFNRSFTAVADNAPFDVTDADLVNIVGTILFSTYESFNDNAVALVRDLGLAFNCFDGNVLHGQLHPYLKKFGLESLRLEIMPSSI